MRFVITYLAKYKKYLILNILGAFGFIVVEIGIPTLFSQGISDRFGEGNTNYILMLMFKMYLLALIGFILAILLSYATDKVTSKITRDVRDDLFRQIQGFSRMEYEKFGVARFITNTGTDAYTIMQFLTLILRTGFIAPMMIVSAFVLIFSKSQTLGIITFILSPLMLLGVYIINKKIHKLSTDQQKKLDNINRNMRENFTGLRVIRAFNKEEFQKKRFANVNRDYMNVSITLFQRIAFIGPIFSVVFATIIMIIIQLGSVYVSDGILEVGSLTAYIEYIFHALFSFLMLGNTLIMYPRFEVATERLKEVFNTQSSITSNTATSDKKITEGTIVFENVSFYYSDQAEESVLSNINFTAKAGETVAFIGSTGSGKSTLIKLLPRFFDVTTGRILIDNVDIREYPLAELRQKISYVPQKATLFSGTIKENLRFGDATATDEALAYAAEIAQAKDFIESLPHQYDEMLAEGGINLSGGQKQRLCIARTLVRKAPIYIFDDSFSALDYKTDAMLRKRLAEEVTDATILIVAQRVGTIMNANKIIVLNEGEIVGTGTHQELLRTNKIYREIAQSQLSEEELAI